MDRFDSCNSIWILDREAQRFARMPRGSKVEPSALQGRWEPFFAFDIHDDGSHVLALNESRTRLLRFWEHSDPCPHCTNDRTEELQVETVAEEG